MAAVGRGYGSGPRLEPCGSPVLRLSHEERPNQRRREERVGERLVFDVQQRRRACVSLALLSNIKARLRSVSSEFCL